MQYARGIEFVLLLLLCGDNGESEELSGFYFGAGVGGVYSSGSGTVSRTTRVPIRVSLISDPRTRKSPIYGQRLNSSASIKSSGVSLLLALKAPISFVISNSIRMAPFLLQAQLRSRKSAIAHISGRG